MSQHAAPPTNTFSKRQITVPYVGTNDILVIFASRSVKRDTMRKTHGVSSASP